jgi:hypothetical protein
MTPGRRVFAIGLGIVVFAGIGAAFSHSWFEYKILLEARSAGTFQTVEGTIDNFQEEYDEDTERESFAVAGVQFSYDARNLTAAFHQTAFDGGPIRPGARVRIGHVDGRIVKLEMARADIPDDTARKTYAGTPPRVPPTDAEIRFFNLPATAAMFVFLFRVALKFELYLRASRILRRVFTGYWPTPSRFFSWLGRGVVLIYLGATTAAFAWLLLDEPIELSWGQLPLFAFFTAFFLLFAEGTARLIVRLGRRLEAGPSPQQIGG